MRTKINKTYVVALRVFILLLLAITLVGCTSKTSETPTNESETTSTNAESETTETSENDKYGGTLKIVSGDNLMNLGLPPLIRSRGDSIVSLTVYETLARYNEAGEIIPWLAKGWEADPEAKTISVELNQGIKFHDGTDFNAEAVKWNIEHYRDKGRVEASAVESIDVLDEYNLKLNLSNWDNSIFEALFGFEQMASPTAYQEKGEEWLQENPVGTGPFVFKEWIKDQKVTFVKNENYWVEGLPYLDAVEFNTIKEPATAEAAMMAGDYDLYLYTSPHSARNLESSFEIETLENANGAIGYSLAPDSENPDSPLTDVNVRKAIGYAIDKQAIVDTIFYGYAEAVNQWAVPKSLVFSQDVEGTPYDPEKAKELLKTAGYSNGLDLTLTFSNNNPDMIQMYTAVQAYLKEVGINLELNGVQSSHWAEKTGSEGTWEDLIHTTFRISNNVIFDFNRSMASDSSHYRMTKLNEDAETLLKSAETMTTSEDLIDLSQQLQELIFGEYQTSIPLVVMSTLLAQNGKVQDHGFLQTQMTHWNPETAWLKK
ncbi:ABC transporter substrate-binding protein [Bacillus sp. Marseille-P3661]|uniref:ABC transporter substrate-binding protein n=1 Tax=Bacillus sp. Marseille-P3661 TaxID=1936234 RepID=UPI0015E1A99A|nr:ABC transporter substrate-binding protein [Bacillus sp. Marseille-P3661]